MKKKIIICILITLVFLTAIISINIKQKKELQNNQLHEYNIYVVNGTLPTLIISLDMVKDRDVPSYLYYARESTLDTEIIKEYFPEIKLSKHIGNYASIQEDLYLEIKKYVREIYEKDPEAHFNFIVDEYRGWLEFPVFIEQGIKENQYSVKYYSDGTLSYVAKYDILKKNSYQLFKEEKESYFQLMKDVQAGKYKCNLKCDYLINEKIGDTEGLMDYNFDANYVLLAPLRDNVEYYLQYPELIKFKDKKIEQEMKKANYKKMNVTEKFNELTEEEKEIFFKLIGLNKKDFDEKYFNSENEKYLIITGSKPFYGKYDKKKFIELMNEVVKEYGEDYKLLYKPHPTALPTKEQGKILKEFDITILPGQIPMEAISFVYNDLKLGGYPSSLYMNVDSNSTLFFFEDSANDLVSPLNLLYDDLFSEAKIMN